MPSLFSAYISLMRHSIAGKKSSNGSAVGLSRAVEGVRINAGQLQRYRDICGYERISNVVPICFPHLPAAALQLGILAAPEFPCAIAGLVHVSQLGQGRVNHARDVMKEEQQISVRVISVDSSARRIALSRLDDRGALLGSEEAADGDTIDAVVRDSSANQATTNLGSLFKKALGDS